jgi:hypothetical protein
MSDIELIRRTIALYAMLLDDSRCDEWGDLFTEDAEWISNYGIYEKTDGKPLFETEGRAEIVRIAHELARQVREAEGKSLHLSSPALIDVSGAAASAWWDFTVLHTDKDGFAIRATGRIYAEFVKQDDVWRIAKRVNLRSGGVIPSGLSKLPPH